MPQQPITGDAGSPRRPRTMDEPRRAAWAAAFKKLNAGLKVWEMPAEEHAALLRPGLFEGLDEVAAQEEAACVLGYWLHEFDWSPIASAGADHCGPLARPRVGIRRPSRRGGATELHPGQRG